MARPAFGDSRDNVVTLRAPGRQERPHALLGSFAEAMRWTVRVRELMASGYGLYEADRIATEERR